MAHIPPDRPRQTPERNLREAQLAVVMVPGERSLGEEPD